MNTSTKIIVAVGLVLGLVVGFSLYPVLAPHPKAESPLGSGLNGFKTFNGGVVQVSGATSTQVLAVNTTRGYARLQGTGSTLAFCAMASAAVTTSTAQFVLSTEALTTSTAANVFLVPPFYAGIVNCIGNGATTSVYWSENTN